MAGLLLILGALGAAAAFGASSGRAPSSGRRGSGASRPTTTTPINPRTERPWCEMRATDWSVAELRNRDALIRWARCSTTSAAELAIMRERLTRAFHDAATDREALAFAQTRDRAEAAWRETHRAPATEAPPASEQPASEARTTEERLDDAEARMEAVRAADEAWERGYEERRQARARRAQDEAWDRARDGG